MFRKGDTNNGGRPKGAWSIVSPKVRDKILREVADGIPKTYIARTLKISVASVYRVLKEHPIKNVS